MEAVVTIIRANGYIVGLLIIRYYYVLVIDKQCYYYCSSLGDVNVHII